MLLEHMFQKDDCQVWFVTGFSGCCRYFFNGFLSEKKKGVT
jgi:hypothetical protein